MHGGHRKDIDGLRAVAILPVLFYHASIWPFSGGYVGVDIFFVISGYLITGLILRAHEAQSFSLVNFYDRRVRRIVPALAAVLLATTVVAPFILLPDELNLFGRSLSGAVLFYGNILYWLRGLGYFAPNADQNPLLHIWSLSVEEQFYLVWPLLLIGLARFRRFLPWTILVLAVASLGLALDLAHGESSAAFYLLPARAWQLLAGAFLAVGALAAPRGRPMRNAIAFGGLAAVAFALLLPGSLAPYHPINAVCAVLGTAAILFAADGGENVVSTLLATRVPVFIGQISYSLYLWHWPALVFTRLILARELTLAETGAVLLAVFVVSILSWRFIEQPLRRWGAAWRGLPLSFPIAGTAAALFGTAVLAFVLTHGLPNRLTPDARAMETAADRVSLLSRCSVPNDNIRGNPAFAAEAVLWGDSHACSLAPGLAAFAESRRMRLRELTLGACLPLPGVETLKSFSRIHQRCTQFNRHALETILQSPQVRLVIIQARWEMYVNKARIKSAGDPLAAMAAAEDALLRTLTARGVAVLLVGNVPIFPDVPADCYGRRRLLHSEPSGCLVLPTAVAKAQIDATDGLLARVASRYPLARVYFPSSLLCDRVLCHATAAGRLLYGDTDHLTPVGALLVGRALDAALGNWPG